MHCQGICDKNNISSHVDYTALIMLYSNNVPPHSLSLFTL